MVRVEISPAARKSLIQLPLGMVQRIHDVIARLERWPEVSGTKPLRGELKGHFRVRSGDWRIVFHLQGDLLIIDKIDNRKDVYTR